MSIDQRMEALMAAFRKTTYFKWMAKEAIPVIDGFGIEDVRDVAVAPWPRTGGKAAFLNLYGMEGVTGMYVGEIAAGGALKPEKHFYEEVIVILEGQGATEIWQDGGTKQMFEWGPWSLFAPPLNTNHRLLNGGRTPVKYLAVTNAPLVMDIVHNEEFVFACPYNFSDRYAAATAISIRGSSAMSPACSISGKPISSAISRPPTSTSAKSKAPASASLNLNIAGNSLIGHLAQWPAARYHKAHYHGAGAILLGLQSSGYVLLWSKESGTRPFEAGRAEDVVEIKWKAGSVYCPGGGWFHQHFNTGTEPARHLALRYGSRIHPIGFKIADKRSEDGVYIDVKQGGTLIEYADEDPYIRKHYEDELKKAGVKSAMPAV